MDELNPAFNVDVPVLSRVEISVDVKATVIGTTVLTVETYTVLTKLPKNPFAVDTFCVYVEYSSVLRNAVVATIVLLIKATV